MTDCNGTNPVDLGLAVAARAGHSCRLPVSGIDIRLRPFSGRDDLLLAEASSLGMALAIALLESLGARSDGSPLDWAALPGTDIDAALLQIRRAVFGDLVSADAVCPAQACGQRIDLRFSLGEFLAHHAPRRLRGVEPAEVEGWFRCAGSSAMFRPPTGGDIAAAADSTDPERELLRRCVRPADVPARALRRILRAVEAMAPSLADELQGECAECGAAVGLYFDARRFALRELRDQAAFVYGDTHLLASHYHWAEADILALPRNRRIHYVEMLVDDRREVA